jgi:NAD kinase
MKYDQVIVVKSKTRLEHLTERFNTKSQAKFYLEHTGGDFSSIEKEHLLFYIALEKLNKLLFSLVKYKVIDRTFLPNYIFTQKDLVVGIGQDGLIANIAKYVKGQPIVGYNPNPNVYDGIFLPYPSIEAQEFKDLVNGEFHSKLVSMAKASFNDGQELLAFNDFFIGQKTHTSSRYIIHFEDKTEQQCSSGIIVSTGAGSTGWMSSINNMVNGIGKNQISLMLEPESTQLQFAVREPFVSKISSANICGGIINLDQKLIIESSMLNNGLVFSDGIEKDFIDFNMGTSVEISIASEKANLVQR